MEWPYRFVDLTEAQKHERRELLDFYSGLAQLSALLPLILIQVSSLTHRVNQRLHNPDVLEAPSSPYLKEGRLSHLDHTQQLQAQWRKLCWWCRDHVEIRGVYLGRRGQVLAAVGWIAWLLICCFVRTGDDYLHLTKRFGIVAASQLPLHYLLAVKSPYSPVQLLTSSSHETLNSYHQLLGRIITILLYLHAAFYLNFYVQANLLAAKVKEAYVICGIVGIIAFTIVGTTALAPVRRWSYRVFYITHITLASALLPILFFHVSHIRIYLFEAAAVYALNVILRKIDSAVTFGSIKRLPHTGLVEVSIPLHGSQENAHLRRWQPGQHAYLSLDGHPASHTLRSNPFSVASIPSADGKLEFYARILNGNTATLARNANTTDLRQKLTVEGPYGVSHSEKLMHYHRVLFVAGGVGATFIVPLYRQLLADLSPSKGSYRRQKVDFLWVARTLADVDWALPEDEKEREGFVERLKVCLTGPGAEGAATEAADFSISNADGNGVHTYSETKESVEMREKQDLMTRQPGGSEELSIYAGRPDLKLVVDQMFSYGTNEKVAVFVCGPGNLARHLRDAVDDWVTRGRDVLFWEEVFAL